MKKKITIGIIILLVILILSFVIPIKTKYKEIVHGEDTMTLYKEYKALYTEYKKVCYNIYGMVIYEEK